MQRITNEPQMTQEQGRRQPHPQAIFPLRVDVRRVGEKKTEFLPFRQLEKIQPGDKVRQTAACTL